jgi:transposase InsO family protein
METHWQADRAALRHLLKLHPDWGLLAFAQTLKRSYSWVKKWRKRLLAADPADETVIGGLSRARKHPPPRIAPTIVDAILEIRDQPPAHLRRTPGPKTIRYFLQHDPSLQGQHLPTSTKTIWQLLRANGRILPPHERHPQPVDLPAPGMQVHLDFKDASTVPPDPDGKQQHCVETLNGIDRGSSIWLPPKIRPDFTAETTLRAVADILQEWGMPAVLVFDRDVRFVGSPGMRDFPSAFVRFLLCLGITPKILPPRRPDLNGVIERLHRSYNEECLQREKPRTLEQVIDVTLAYRAHYLEERPHQGRACGNRPPAVAFADLPARPPVPTIVDPDRWVQLVTGQCFVRKVRQDTSILLDDLPYYVTRALVGQEVQVRVDAETNELVVEHEGQEVRRWPIKGLAHRRMPFDEYVEWVAEQARTERLLVRQIQRARGAFQLPLPF